MSRGTFPGLTTGLLLLAGCLAPTVGGEANRKNGDGDDRCRPGAFDTLETLTLRKATPYGPATPVTGIARLVDLPGGLVVTTLSQNEDQRGPALSYQLFDGKTFEPLQAPHTIVDGEEYFADRPKVLKTGERLSWIFTRHHGGFSTGTSCAAFTVPNSVLTEADGRAADLYDAAPTFRAGSCGGVDAAWNGELVGLAFANERGSLAFQHLINTTVRPTLVDRETSIGPFSAFDGVAIGWNERDEKYILVYSKETEDGNTELFSSYVTIEGNPTTREPTKLSDMGGRSRWARLIPSSGGFGLTWFEVGAGSSVDGLYFRPLDADGAPTGPAEKVAPAAPGAADLAYNEYSQRFGVTWTELDGGVYFTQLDKNGRTVDEVRQLDRKIHQRATPTLALALDGSFLVTWTDSPRAPLSLARICGEGPSSGGGDSAHGHEEPGDAPSDSSLCGAEGATCCAESAAQRCVDGTYCSSYSNTCVEQSDY